MIMPDIVPLTEEIKSLGHHITIETAATVIQPVKVDLASISPKLSNSTPTQRQGGRFKPRGMKTFAPPESPPVIQQFIDSSPDFQLKFVVLEEPRT